MKRLLYLFFLLVLCNSIYASDINILTYRNIFSPKETFQAEIIFDNEPINDLTTLNFEFYKNKPIGTLMFLEKLSSKRYFVYFNIPNVEKGNYLFRVKNVNVINNGILKKISEEIIIEVKKINSGFEYLTSNQNQNGDFGDITKTSLGALALKNINQEKSNLAISYLLNNQDPTGCYLKDNCNIRDTSFALITLNKFNQNYIKTKNWLKDASNNFELGIWNLKLEGVSSCDNIQLNGVYNLNVNDNEIKINCNSQVNFKLTHSYLGNSYTIKEYIGNSFNYTIDDSGCYGIKYKEKCDYINTLYASWALNEINEEFPEEYLKNNKLDNRTIDHGFGYLLYNDNYDKDWLLNNYLNGYWSYYSASISQEPDYFVSAIVTYALKEEFLFEESKNYLNDKTNENILDSAIILYLLFDDNFELPSVSISPGIVNKKNSFNLKIKNNKKPINVLIESPNSYNLPKEINLQNEVNYNLIVKESFDLIVRYGNYSYTIPIIGKNDKLSEEKPLLPPSKDSIKFLNDNVELSLNVDDVLTDYLEFVNNWEFELTNITIEVDEKLKGILELEQYTFDSIKSNETLNTKIYLNKNKNPVYPKYEGDIFVKSAEGTLSSINFLVNFVTEPIEVKEEINEEEILDENLNKSEEKNIKPIEKKRNLWWLWLIIIIIIGIIIFVFFRRKKEVVQSFGDYAKNINK